MPMTDAPSPQLAWRREKTILVTEASALGMIAAIRSLGRAGYRVHACSADPAALGLKSKLATCATVHPRYDDPAFLPWLFDYLRRHRIDAVLPSESFLLAVRPVYQQVAPLMPIGPDEDTVFRCFSKFDVIEHFRRAPVDSRVTEHLPESFLWRSGDPLPTQRQLAGYRLPIFIKADGVQGTVQRKGVIHRAMSVDEACDAIRRLSAAYSAILVQSFVTGTRVVADFCIWNGQIWSRSMMEAQHESPHYGGISTLRTTTWDQAIWDDAERKLRCLGLEGVAMMEYRRDPETGEFHYIEINARYWTGVHVEMGAGIDIPTLQADAFFDRPQPVPDPRTPRIPYRYTFPGEMGYLGSLLKDRSVPVARKLKALGEFLVLGMDPRVKSDLSFPGDRSLWYRAMVRYFRDLAR